MKRDLFETATFGADRGAWVRAVVELLQNAPPGSTVVERDGKPVLLRPRKTIAELRAEMRAAASRWSASERRGRQ
jgi:hypothetical protein